MNLTQLFNIDYFVQNLKKSKSNILLAFAVLPIITTIFLLIYNSASSSNVLNFEVLNIFNIMLMYIIPVVLSLSLFNYVFKKNSADFVGSLPISRKNIFVTNTVFGVLTIMLLQAITAILVFVLSQILPNITVFNAMIGDSFLYFTMAYSFVFIVCNLAISFSGNMFATIASTMLILFLVPFSLFIADSPNRINNYSNFEDKMVYYENYNFTAPSFIFEVFSNDGGFEYSNISIAKMIILSLVYAVIGLKLFERKKLEMAEESFENDKTHIIIKCLTLAPFVGIASALNVIDYPYVFLFFAVMLAIYYFVFDIITKKKIELKKSILAFVISFIAMYAIYDSIIPKLDFIYRREVDPSTDVKSIYLLSIEGKGDYESILNLEIGDKEVIREILKLEGYSYPSSKYNAYANVRIMLQNGKSFETKKYLSDSIDKIINVYGDGKYEFPRENYKVVLSQNHISKDEEKELINCINQDLSNKTIKEFFDIILTNREYYSLYLVCYKNHKLQYNDMSYSPLNNTVNYTIAKINKTAVERVDRVRFTNLVREEDFRNYVEKVNPKLPEYYEKATKELALEEQEDYEYEILLQPARTDSQTKTGEYEDFVYNILYEGVSSIDSHEIGNYILKHKNDDFDHSKPYFVILNDLPDSRIFFYSNDLEDFYKIYAKSYNDNIGESNGILLNENT